MSRKNIPQRSTGSSAISESLAYDGPLVFVCVKLSLSAVGGVAESFTVTLNSATDSVYDTILLSQDMSNVKDLFWQPESPVPITDNDSLDFAYANSNGRTYGIEITYQKAGV